MSNEHWILCSMYFVTTLAVFVWTCEALKGFNLLQLPSHATLQAYTGAFIDDPGKICIDPNFMP